MARFLLALVLLTTTLSAEIVEVKQMHEIKSHLKPDTLVIFDIDNCLIEPKQLLGSDQWGYHQIAKYQKEGLTKEEAFKKVNFEFTAIHNITEVKPVETTTPDLIRTLQKKNYTLMALTGRAPDMAAITIKQLNDADYDLTPTTLSKNEISFKNGEKEVLLKKGILFTALSHKGTALFTLFSKLNYKPKRILFIDDKLSYVTLVENSCNEHKVPYVGLRYGYLDDKINNFRSDIADKQFEAFKNIPSDQEIAQTLPINQIKKN